MLVLHLLFTTRPPAPILCQNESIQIQRPVIIDNRSFKDGWKLVKALGGNCLKILIYFSNDFRT